MGVGLHLLMVLVSVNFLAEASTGDADYETVGDHYENQETFERSSKLNRVNKSSARRPHYDVDNVGPQVVDDMPPNGERDTHPVQDEANDSEAPAVADKQPMVDRHSAFRLSPTLMPVSTVQVIKTPVGDFEATREDMIFMATVAGCSAAAVVIISIIGFGWYRMSLRHQYTSSESGHPDLWWGIEGDFRTLGRLHRRVKAAADVDYPAYGVTGPNKEISPTGDRKLAENAQMYHYQHQKQQIISMSNSRVSSNDQRGSGSEAESDEENEEGDYTVYECPGLAATGEMEVKNPLFQDDPTPAGAPEPPSQPQSNASTKK